MRMTRKQRALMKDRSGFTMVEFALTLGLATLAIAAIVATNQVQVILATSQRDVVVAHQLANSFLAQLVGESVNWNSDYDFNSTETPLLLHGLGGDAEGTGEVWYAVPNNGATGSPYFNSLGVPSETMIGNAALNTDNGLVNSYSQRFCIHYRLEYVVDMAPLSVLNVQVRVLFPRDPTAYGPAGVEDCGFAEPDDMFDNTDLFRSQPANSNISQQTVL